MQNNNRSGTPTNQRTDNSQLPALERRRAARSRVNAIQTQNNMEINLSDSFISCGGVRQKLIFSYGPEPMLNPTCKLTPANRKDHDDSNGPAGAICTGKMIPCGR